MVNIKMKILFTLSLLSLIVGINADEGSILNMLPLDAKKNLIKSFILKTIEKDGNYWINFLK